MKRLLVLSFLLLAATLVFAPASGQTVLWEETFEDEADGATVQNGATVAGTLGGTWSVTTPTGGAASFSKQNYDFDLNIFGCFTLLSLNVFQINGTGTEGVWQSNVINISGLGDVAIEVDLGISGASAADYVRAFYRIDGGAEIQFGEVRGGGGVRALANTQSAIISGSNVQIVIRGMENTAGNVICGSPNVMAFDNVRLTDISSLYSRADGNWNATATWSTTGYAGASCGCTPSSDTKVFIGNGRTVNVNAAAEAVDVNVENTGTLRWTANNLDLDIRRGGSVIVSNGGTITRNGFTGAQIDFDDPYTNIISVAAGGTLSVEDIDINGATSVTFSGGGTVTLSDDLLMGVNDGLVTNNMTGSLTITDQLNFEVSGVDFVNNGSSMTVQGATGIVLGGDNGVLNNTGTLSLTGATRSISFPTTSTGNLVTNSGTLSGITVYFDDDDNAISNSGTFSLSGAVQAGANDDGCVITNTGTFSFSALTINNANITINNSGTITQSGSFTSNNIDTGSAFNNLAGGVWNWTLTPNAGFDADVATVLNLSAANNTFNYSGAGAQSVLAITYGHLTISGSGTKASLGDLDVNGDLSIAGSAQLDVDTGNDMMTLGGNWSVTSSNADPFLQGAGTEMVTLDGTGTQTISRTGGETFNRITVNKSSGTVVLNCPVVIAGGVGIDLILTQGIVITTSTNLLTFNDGANSNEGDADSFVDGPVRKIGNDAFVFPTGDGTVWARIGISAPATITTEFTAEYVFANFGTLTVDGTLNDPSDNEYWNLNRAVTTDGVRVTLYWEDNTRSSINDAVSGDLVVARFNGSNWTSHGQFSITSAGSTGTVTSNVISSFSPITFGSLSASVNPLPIELLSFTAQQQGGAIRFDWSTASELNNDFFTIERLRPDDSFEQVLTLPGKGTTHELSTYQSFDRQPQVGKNYYRLKQTDFDGQFSYSDLVMVDFVALGETVRIYPNPARNENLTIEIDHLQPNERVPVTVRTAIGAVALQQTLVAGPSGTIRVQVSTADWVKGLYLIQLGSQQALQRKVVIE